MDLTIEERLSDREEVFVDETGSSERSGTML